MIDIELEAYIENRLRILAEDIDLDLVQNYRNDVFEMHEYVENKECDCGLDAERDRIEEENPCTEDCLSVDGPCICGAEDKVEEWYYNHKHKDTCASLVPNFRCGDVSITWYKHIGRGMEINQSMTREELRAMFRKCDASLD